MEQEQGHFWVGPWQVEPSLNRIVGEGASVQVEPRIMGVLVCLAEHAGEVVTRDVLAETVWADTYVGDDPLNRAISELRKVFGDDPRNPQVIETIRKSGYRLIAPVSAAPVQDTRLSRHRNGQSPEPPFTLSRPRRGLLIGLVAAAVVSLIGVAWWAAPLGAGEEAVRLRPTRLTSFPGRELDPMLSAGGDRVAFSWEGAGQDNFDLYVKVLGAETPLRLTTDPGSDESPAWSPDDQSIAFIRRSGDACALFLIPALGGPERRLAPCDADAILALSWSPDGAYLAFPHHEAPEEALRLYLLSLETLEARPLTAPPASDWQDLYPAFSPDGTELAFVRRSFSGVDNLYLIPTTGGPSHPLTEENQRVISLTWSDDRHLLYSSDRDGTFSLWRISARGGTPEWLLTGSDSIVRASVDRQNGRLVYADQGLDKNIWRLSLGREGATPEPLVASTRWDMSPHYAPVRTAPRIAFMSNRSGSYEIWLAEADGQNPVALTAFGGALVGTPRWSPDGTRIVFDARSEQNADLFVVAADGGVPRRLTTHPANDAAPSWSQDGQWLYFGSSRSGAWEVWKLPVAGGEAVPVTRNGGFAAFESVDGSALYFTKRGTPGLWRRPVSGGAEVLLLGQLHQNDWGNWSVTDQGIYFLDRRAVAGATFMFYSFASEEITPVLTLHTDHLTNPGLSVTPDGTSLLYVNVDRHESDLMLVEGFE